MIAASRFAKVGALCIAALAHAALALAVATPEEARIEGAAGAAEVRLGNAFADMVQGTLPAQEAESEITPDRPEITEAVPAGVMAPQPAPAPVERAAPEVATPLTSALATPSQPAEPERAKPGEMALAARPEAATPAETVRPQEAQQAQAAAEALEGTPPEDATVRRSLRPRQRSAAFEAEHEPAPPPRRVTKPQPKKTAPKRQQKAAPARAQQTARAGQATGTRNATARTSGSGGRDKSAGNAAASNYPGQVMRKIARAGRPRVRARGAAVVAFSIASGGGLTSVSIARSSGSQALDRAALRVVRNAAPFPRPPSGARRSFTIQIQGR